MTVEYETNGNQSLHRRLSLNNNRGLTASSRGLHLEKRNLSNHRGLHDIKNKNTIFKIFKSDYLLKDNEPVVENEQEDVEEEEDIQEIVNTPLSSDGDESLLSDADESELSESELSEKEKYIKYYSEMNIQSLRDEINKYEINIKSRSKQPLIDALVNFRMKK